MRFVTYSSGGSWRTGVLAGDAVVDVAGVATEIGIAKDAATWVSLRRVLGEVPPEQIAQMYAAAVGQVGAHHTVARNTITLGPPIPDPQKILCIGLNYSLHVREVGLDAPPFPEVFAKFPNSLVGPHDSIKMNPRSDMIDYEGELAVVVGKRGKNVPPQEAWDYVAGLMVFNDVSARDLQMRGSQWLPGKSCDTFAPCGPSLVTLDEVELDKLRILTMVNGQVRQSAPVSQMTFSIPDIVAELSSLMTLEVGDIIATGTPAGVGMSFEPPRYLNEGDVVEVEIPGLGSLSNSVVPSCVAVEETVS